MSGNISFWALACAVAAVGGYLLGSISFAIIASKIFYKEDVRTKGSGNAGMTNMLRTYGKKVAIFTLLGDVAKGVLAVWVGRWIFMLLLPSMPIMVGAYIAAVFAVLGHTFPLYFGFKGGKGVAVSGGVIIALSPITALILVALFLALVLTTKIVSLGSVIGMSLYPVVTLIKGLIQQVPTGQLVYSVVCSAVIAGLVVWMHRGNIQRLLNGTEYKFGQKKPEEQTDSAAEQC